MKFATGLAPMKYGIDRLIQMPDSMVSSSTSGSVERAERHQQHDEDV